MLSALLVVASLAIAQPAEETAARAIGAIREGRDTEARALIAEATTAIAKAPLAAEWRTWRQLAIAHLMLGSFDEAARIFNSLLNSAGGNKDIRDAALVGLARVAIAQRDPVSAIRHVEQVDSKEGRRWLAVALMMESRGASDEYVRRAFDTAERARLDRPQDARPRADIAAALGPGEMMIVFLAGETHAYAWAIARDAFIGYALPPPAEIVVAADRARVYADQNDAAGLRRIAEDVMPGLLGPVMDRLPQLNRLILVPDETLRRFPLAAMPVRRGQPPAISIIDNGPLTDAVIRDAPRLQHGGGSNVTMVLAGSVIAAIAAVSLLARRRLRAPS